MTAVWSRDLPRAAFVAIALLAWWLLVRSAEAMRTMQGDGPLLRWMMVMMQPAEPGVYLPATFAMWSLMMIAMMIPAAMPLVMLYQRTASAPKTGLAPALLMLGYLLAWIGYAAVAAVAQWGLHRMGLLHGMSLTASPVVGGMVLISAGIYQLTPLKEACLAHCRSPFGFLLGNWQPGHLGALRMGFHHGSYCVGCCWVLMLLMFAGGAMSVLTMALLTLFIVGERLLPAGPWVSRLPGVAMLVCGAALAATVAV